jgi:hypothetical protein
LEEFIAKASNPKNIIIYLEY